MHLVSSHQQRRKNANNVSSTRATHLIMLFCITKGYNQGRSQTFSFGGATGGASFATRGAVNGLCRTFRKRPEKFWGGPAKILGGSGPPWHPPRSAPGYNTNINRCNFLTLRHFVQINSLFSLDSVQKVYIFP